ncbi:MAG: sulfurtransferase TusA family protein [Rubellimicrobium sp.]|nr:sulfurtransferase TusA family protein [Rubellimicrobium sp.]
MLCPLPVLRARKVLAGMEPGAVLRVLADDAMARIDLPHFCGEAGHAHLGITEEADARGEWQSHLIRCGTPLGGGL